MDWNNMKILYVEPNYTKRLVSETLHIKDETSALNLKPNCEMLDNSDLLGPLKA